MKRYHLFLYRMDCPKRGITDFLFKAKSIKKLVKKISDYQNLFSFYIIDMETGDKLLDQHDIPVILSKEKIPEFLLMLAKKRVDHAKTVQ